MCRLVTVLLLLIGVARAFVVPFSSRHFSKTRQSILRSASASSASEASIPSMNSMKSINGLSDIVNDYDVFLLDMWGVMHDGSRPYDGVLETIQQLKNCGKRLVILSNSSKRKDNSIKMLKQLGFCPDDFEQIITSGEIVYQILSGARPQKANKNVFVLGSGEDDVEYCNSCGWNVSPIKDASLLIARGTFTLNDGSTVIDKLCEPFEYNRVLEQSLQEAAKRRMPMYVCNPDKLRPDGDMSPMPGEIGDVYEAALGGGPEAEACVPRIGKPFPLVFDIALGPSADRSRAIMIGDALETDVTGGCLSGIPTLWVVCSGIHRAELAEQNADTSSLHSQACEILTAFNQKQGTYAKGRQLCPDYVVSNLQW